jgi:hypothetical protein
MVEILEELKKCEESVKSKKKKGRSRKRKN